MRRLLPVLLAAVLALPLPAGASIEPVVSPDRSPDHLSLYTATVAPQEVAELRESGFDVVGQERVGEQIRVELVLSSLDRAKLESRGVDVRLSRNAEGRTFSQQSRIQRHEGYHVWRSYSELGGIQDELYRLARRHPRLVRLVKLGESVQGQDILAAKVTRGARRGGAFRQRKPAVLYLSMQHAREWITVEMTMRLLRHYLDNYDSDHEIRRLVDNNELWFLPVANPDGYDYTFTEGNRLWRKNLRDNNGDGEITATADGVDLNRNFATNWGYDNEGSSPDPSSQVYRGPGPNSEPETQALERLFRRVDLEFLVNYHSAAELLLYGVGWQVDTPTPDDNIYQTLAGTDANPAVEGYDPDLSAELYITNGDTTDHAHERHHIMSFTPEMSTCQTASAYYDDDPWEPGDCASGFNFPDDERLVQEEFERNLPFALDIARSARHPRRPESHLGRTAPVFEVDEFSTSYGSPQVVQTDVRRGRGRTFMYYRINDGRRRRAPTHEWRGGERYGDTNDVHYAYRRGVVRGAEEGDTVEVWFRKGRDRSFRFTYEVASDSRADVLIVADTDYGSPLGGGDELRYLDYYTDALESADLSWDVYDVTAWGEAPDPLGVLGHYDAVVWYTGDKYVTDYEFVEFEDGGRNTTTKLAHDMYIVMRDYLNEGGKLLATGKHLGFQEFLGIAYGTNGAPEQRCDDPQAECLFLTNDVYQYYLGGYERNNQGGLGPDGNALPVQGTDDPYAGLSFALDGGDSANNQGGSDGTNEGRSGTASWIPTSDVLPPDEFPQFTSWRSATWQTEGAAPYEPRTGETQVASQQADISYKRLSRTVDLTGASNGELSFWTSYNTEANWDFLFVEARPVGTDDWTTLPDANGHTTQETGASCAAGWGEQLHPQLLRYQTPGEDGCTPTGTTGEWHAASGTSEGWENWSIDLSAYAEQQVEVSITYASDWATQGLGVFVDDTTVTVDGTVAAETSFEDDFGGWTVAGAPEGSAENANDWVRTGVLFNVSATVTTEDTVLHGFGFEGIRTQEQRNEVMEATMDFLLP